MTPTKGQLNERCFSFGHRLGINVSRGELIGARQYLCEESNESRYSSLGNVELTRKQR